MIPPRGSPCAPPNFEVSKERSSSGSTTSACSCLYNSEGMPESTVVKATGLHADRECHIWPGGVGLALNPPQVGARDREARVVEEARDGLNRGPRIPAE